jgi:hypothetical protein
MGIMNSDLIKTGIDVLTKLLEIINKMTAGIGKNGFGGGIMKLMTVFGVFKMGMALFKKFESPLNKFFANIVKKSGEAGEKSGKAFAEGVQKGGKKSEANN